MVAESWFHGLWKPSKKHNFGPEKVRIGVLVFEVASVMSKLVHQWNSLTDKQVMKLRDEIGSSVGIKKLVSDDDDDYVVDLICAEMLHTLENSARIVTRLARKCRDPVLKCFERAYDDLIKSGVDQYQWQFSWKKMNGKVRKMETFVLVNANLYQEMENLAEIEQILRRMKSNDDHDSVTVVEYTKKSNRKQQQVKRLKEISLWNRTHDYVVLLLARSIFTIFGRIGHVFGINHVLPRIEESSLLDSERNNHSLSALLQSSIHPSENRITRFSSGPLGNVSTKSGPISRTNNSNKYHSGPLGNSITSISSKHRDITSFSGPLVRAAKTGMKWWHTRDNKSSKIHGKSPTPNHLSTSGAFRGCMMGGNGSPTKNHHLNPVAACSAARWRTEGTSNRSSKWKGFDPPPGTLGAVALALHYANVIIVLEKLVASPHLIGHDARDDLYNMLPKTIRTGLRARLKPYAKSLGSSVYDTGLAEEWTEAMLGILDWLSPMAHNTIRWQSERSFEHQNLLSRTHILLVQTLYYANQEKTEATITELLIGLNYIWRFSREITAKALLECENGADDLV